MPSHLVSWFRRSGYNTVEESTNLVFDKGFSNLLEANRKFVAGHNVCLFVGANILQGLPKGRAPADHWVVMTSPLKVDNKPAASYLTDEKKKELGEDIYSLKIMFDVYTWGRNNYSVNSRNQSMTVNQFLDYYYGYVAVNA